MSTSRASRRVERKRKSKSTGRDLVEYGKARFSEDDPVLPVTVVRSNGDGSIRQRGEKEGARALSPMGHRSLEVRSF